MGSVLQTEGSWQRRWRQDGGNTNGSMVNISTLTGFTRCSDDQHDAFMVTSLVISHRLATSSFPSSSGLGLVVIVMF